MLRQVSIFNAKYQILKFVVSPLNYHALPLFGYEYDKSDTPHRQWGLDS